MPKRRRVLSTEERIEAYEHAIHDLWNTIVIAKQAAENAINGVGSKSKTDALQYIVGLAEGRIVATSADLEPAYKGYKWEVVEADS